MKHTVLLGGVVALVNVLCGSLWYALALFTGTTFAFPILFAEVAAFSTVWALKRYARDHMVKAVVFWFLAYVALFFLLWDFGLAPSHIYRHFHPDSAPAANDRFGLFALYAAYLVAYWGSVALASYLIRPRRASEESIP